MEQIVVTPTPVVDDQAHIDAMTKLADGLETPAEAPASNAAPASNTETPPTLFAGKYKTVEELEKGYQELAKKLGQPTPPVTPPVTTDPSTTSDPAADPGLQPFFAEFAEKGVLSADSYQKLAAKGLTKDVVDSYIEGQKAQRKVQEIEAEQAKASVFAIVGGEAQYNAEIEWARSNFTPTEIKAFNKAVEDIDTAHLAVEGLHARFTKANTGVKLLLGGGEGALTGDVYESIAQMTADMNKPEYRKDPAFQRRVQEKLGRSKILS